MAEDPINQKVIQSIHTIQNNGDLINPSDSAYTSENKHDNGKATIGKCIPIENWPFPLPVLVFRSLLHPTSKTICARVKTPDIRHGHPTINRES